MNILYMPRGTGKTTQLIRWLLKADNRALIVTNEVRADFLRKEFKTDRVVSAYQAQRTHWARDTQIAVDDVDQVLPILIGHPVVVGTISSHNTAWWEEQV